ncbi:hypothetical protein VPNG_00301 [Cytospora leucostoma]|uniref:Extracellular membrane protein CFEM domain-containing protein n=1 Tax=Cytospora leucostoma TaxID=1230097 RepID=A0A423XP98_9PEZI|nr:hypothetical protein VPNG_00301 [Cytospora leucostoma]
MLLSSTLRNALLSVAILLPAHVLADDEDDSVTFGFSDCVSTCVATTGYSTNGEANQKVMCTATRDGLLEAVMACMVSNCSGGLSNVASDLLEPMETGCKELEMPIDVEDTQEAASVAASIEAAAVVTSSIITTASTSIEVLQTISTTMTETPIPISTTPTPEVQTSLIGLATTLDPVILITITAQAATTPEQPPRVVTSATASNSTSAVGIVPVEQQPTSVLSAESTLQTATIATTEIIPVLSSSVPSTLSASITNRLSLVQQEPTTTRATTMATPSTTGGQMPSVHPDATKKAEAKSTTASTRKATLAIETEASRTGDATTQATIISSSAPGPESLSRTATSATNAGSALEMATGSPTAAITSGFATSTSFGLSLATASSTGSSSSPEATDNVGTGDPFSIVTDSAAAAARPRGRLSLISSAVPVAMAVLASVL